VLNPLDEEDEHGEDDDCQADVKQIRHRELLGLVASRIKKTAAKRR